MLFWFFGVPRLFSLFAIFSNFRAFLLFEILDFSAFSGVSAFCIFLGVWHVRYLSASSMFSGFHTKAPHPGLLFQA